MDEYRRSLGVDEAGVWSTEVLPTPHRGPLAPCSWAWCPMGGLQHSLGMKPYRRTTPQHVAAALHQHGSWLWGYALGVPLGAQHLLWHLASGASSRMWIKCWMPCSPWKNLPLGKWHRWEAAKQPMLHSYVWFCGVSETPLSLCMLWISKCLPQHLNAEGRPRHHGSQTQPLGG